MPASVRLVLDDQAIRQLYVSPTGVVGGWVKNLASRVVVGAKLRAPYRTGRLRNSIVAERRPDGGWVVTAKAPYAIYVHEGTRRMRGRPFLTQALEAEIRR